MIELFGKKYITDKEAAVKYGYSQAWFIKRRNKKLPPFYTKMHNKIYYDIDELDVWFRQQLMKHE